MSRPRRRAALANWRPTSRPGGTAPCSARPTRRSRWPRASWHRSSTPSTVTGGRSTRCWPAWPPPSGGSALLEGEDHELGERLAETEQARHRLQAAVAETEAAHGQATRRLEVGRGGPPPGRTGATTVRWPVPTRSSGRSTRPEEPPGPSCWPGWTAWSGPCSTWSRWTPGWEDAFEAGGGRLDRRGGGLGERARQGRARPTPPGWRHRGRAGAHRCRHRRRAGPWRIRPGAPAGTESIRRHVRPAPRRAGTSPGWRRYSTRSWPARSVPSVDGPKPSIWPSPARTWSWSRGRATGSRPPGWRVRARAAGWSPRRWSRRRGAGRTSPPWRRPRRPRSGSAARAEVEATRTAAADAVRADDRNEVEHQTARAARQRVAERPDDPGCRAGGVRRGLAELDERIERDTARAVRPP